ncbi:MAG: insulinase family protein [Planctomycetes bacterium]|nr:insulinase family protein [Planctomycetota bacterium]
MRRLAPLALALLVASLGCQSLQRDGRSADSAETAFTPDSPGYREFTLENGLHVVFREKHDVPVVSCVVAYAVGGVNEKTGRTGLSHFLEHMMFKGTDRYAKGQIDLLTMTHGGQNNAFTAEDCTAYHFTFAAPTWEVALEIEANRMRNCLFDPREIDSEREVVIEELMGNLDTPWEMLYQKVTAALFRGHPYEHPVIGTVEDLRRTTRDDFFAHYKTWYCPNNATLCVVGDFDPAATEARIRALLGPIPRQPLPTPPTVFVPSTPATARIEFHQGFNLDRMMMAFAGPRIGQPQDYALDLASYILTNGKSSRLYRRLVEVERLCSAVDTGNDARQYGGMFMVDLEMLPGKDRRRAEAIVQEELDRLTREPVTPAELARARKQLTAGFVFQQESTLGLAQRFATLGANATTDYFFTYLDHVNRLGASDVQRVAKEIFRADRRVVGWSLAGAESMGGTGRSPAGRHRAACRAPALSPATPVSEGYRLGEQWRVVTPSGLTILILPRPDLPIAAVQTWTKSGALCETDDKAGVSQLLGGALDAGTTTRSKAQIAEAIESVGGSLEAGADGCSARVLSDDLPLALDLISDMLRHATFPAVEIEKAREMQLAGIISKQEDPDPVAADLFDEIVYAGHPYHRPGEGYEKTVKLLTRDDVLAHYRSHFVPNNTVIAIVGRVRPVAVLKLVADRFAGWEPRPVSFPPVPRLALAEKGREKYHPMDKEQIAIVLGHLGVKRSSPDYIPLLVMDYILGTGSGFTDRISKTLRDEEGLAYGCGASITSSAGEEPGTFRAWMATQPDNKEAAIQGLRREIGKFVADGPTPQELANAQEYLCGSLALSMESLSSIAGYLIRSHRNGLGPDYLEKMPAQIRAVTVDEVRRVAREYLHPDRMTLVVAGPVDEKGNVKSSAPAGK